MIIVDADQPVTLLGGGETSAESLAQALGFAPLLVAADGGADRALAYGYTPDAVIGDLDSLGELARRTIPADRLHQIPEQETTDFDKALRSIRAPLVLGVGFLGGRLDHSLAALSGLLARPTPPCLLIGEVDLCFLAPLQLRLTLPIGSRLSLLPLREVSGRSDGLEWPIAGDAFRLGGRLGASNRVSGEVRLEFDAPGMLVILPNEALPAAIAALTACSAP